MATRTFALRRFLTAQPRLSALPVQRRWAAVHDVRWLATTQESRSVLEKYREKLAQRAKQEGLENIDQLKAAYAEKIAQVRKADGELPPGALVGEFDGVIEKVSDAEAAEPAKNSQDVAARKNAQANRAAAEAITKKATEKPGSGVKPLNEILDLEKVRALPDRELTAIWRLRHAAKKDSLCAVIPASTYLAMDTVARRAPQFVLPVPHPEQGAEIHFLQWTFDAASQTSTILFTQLAEYKARGEFAQPHTTITHHLDLADERGLVLMHGQVMEGRGARVQDAQFLVMCMQKFYGAWEGVEAGPVGEERRRLVDYFAAGDARFSLEKLMEETERLV
ncbi:hypothetical protein TD95_002339 [Thielaviopsis punctulata]|uniref:ATP11 protein n=1 Tax=Thielaviopsis punctulata TaxID=72032 RepID=A0A0F4ZGY1_9PEZI|nr:hypothetical protein TD95_002339 [Thielaviopsis punctulata]